MKKLLLLLLLVGCNGNIPEDVPEVIDTPIVTPITIPDSPVTIPDTPSITIQEPMKVKPVRSFLKRIFRRR